MTTFAAAVNSALLHFVWQGAIVVVLLRLALFTMAGRSANARYLAAAVALLSLPLLPVATVLFILLRPGVSLMNGVLLADATRAVGTFVVSRTTSIALFQRWTLPLWSLGAALCSLRFLRGYSTVESLRSSGTPADLAVVRVVRQLQTRLGIGRSVHVLLSAAIDGPSVVGWLRPVVLIPAATVLGLTAEQLEMILAHELAHIRRHDYLVNMIQMGVETILFYHPGVWWVSARMREERELCCDDVVVQLLGHRLTYARALTALERLRLNAPTLALASTDGSLSYRVQRLLEVSPSSSHPMKLPTLLTVCLALACAAPVIDSPRNKPAASGATTEQAANAEANIGGWKNEQDRIQAGQSNPNENGDNEFYRVKTAAGGSIHLSGQAIAGLRLSTIQLSGVTPALRDRIQLPVAVGTTLASDSPSRIEEALAKADSNLSMEIKPLGDGTAALLISWSTERMRGWATIKPDGAVLENRPPLRVRTETVGGTIRTVPDTGRARASNGPKRIEPDQPFFDFQVEQQVRPAPGNTAPSYPAELRTHNIEGNATIQFVVDTTGQADMTTFKELSSSDPLFTESVKNHLPAMRFIPAEVGNRKVKQLVRMPFVFTLSR